MLRGGIWAAVLALSIIACGNAEARIVARIDISQQEMNVYVDGVHRYSWPVSTGRRGYRTPTGVYSPKWLARRHFSSKYYGSPMPYSIFFRGGYAIHGTNYMRRLGRPASHGCVRLAPSHARRLFNLVSEYGRSRTRIIIRH